MNILSFIYAFGNPYPNRRVIMLVKENRMTVWSDIIEDMNNDKH